MSEGIIIAIVGLLSVVLSQALNSLLQKLLGRAKEKTDQDQKFREELRTEIRRRDEEIAKLRAENEILDRSRDKWRFDYFVLYQVFHELKAIAVGLLHRAGETDIVLPQLPARRHTDEEDV